MALLRGFWVLLVLLPSFFQPQVLWLSCNSRSPCSSFPPEHLRFKKFLLFFYFCRMGERIFPGEIPEVALSGQPLVLAPQHLGPGICAAVSL